MNFQENLDYLALIFSALMHDVNHNGKNNTFEINTFSKLAIIYNDKSVLEQHHSAVTYQILAQKDSNIFEKLSVKDFKNVRRKVIGNILATDMKFHFEMMKELKTLINSSDYDP